ncbi:ORF1A, partial [Fowl aviadenovirus B]
EQSAVSTGDEVFGDEVDFAARVTATVLADNDASADCSCGLDTGKNVCSLLSCHCVIL